MLTSNHPLQQGVVSQGSSVCASFLQWEFVSAFRQAQRQQNALAIVNSGMRVRFREGGGVIEELSILYGGVGSTTVSAKNSCQRLIGR